MTPIEYVVLASLLFVFIKCIVFPCYGDYNRNIKEEKKINSMSTKQKEFYYNSKNPRRYLPLELYLNDGRILTIKTRYVNGEIILAASHRDYVYEDKDKLPYEDKLPYKIKMNNNEILTINYYNYTDDGKTMCTLIEKHWNNIIEKGCDVVEWRTWKHVWNTDFD